MLDGIPQLIFPTKLYQPPVRVNLVQRTGLYKRLADGLSRKVTLVSAPAGFGKTTLVSSWLKREGFRTSWLSLDQQDNSLSCFLTYLGISLGSSQQAFNNYSLDTFQTSNLLHLQSFQHKILEQLTSQHPFRILVIDDYHLITSVAVHETLSFILQNIPQPDPISEDGGRGTHVVIITRADPPFPLARWRLDDALNEIRTADLRFSLEEATELLNNNLNLGLPLDDIADLQSRAEGWVAGLQLAAVSMQGQKSNSYHQFLRQLKGNYRLLSDYLIDEVFMQQSSRTQAFLLKTAILERMNGELCDAVLDQHGSQSTLEKLERNNVFVVPLDHERHWYRYHHFFADVLKERLKLFQDEQQKELHSRAAQWLAEHGYIDDSVRHWLQAEDIEQAAHVVISSASKLLNVGKFCVLHNLLEYFPEDAYQQSPWLCVYHGWADMMIEPQNVQSWLLLAEDVIHRLVGRGEIHAEESARIRGDIAAIRALNAIHLGNPEVMLYHAQQALELLSNEVSKVRGLVINAMGTGYLLKGEQGEALKHFLEAKTILQLAGNFGGSAESLSMAGDIQLARGKLHLAEIAFKEAIALQERSDGEPYFTSLAYTGFGTVLYLRNQLDAAFEYLEEGYHLSTRMGLYNQVSCGVSLARARLELGDLERSETILNKFIRYLDHVILPPWIDTRLVACQIHFLASQGDFLGIKHLTTNRGISFESKVALIREPEFTAYALSLLIRGDFKGAENLASKLERITSANNAVGRQIHVLAILGTALMLQGRLESAQTSVVQALNLGAREGFIRTFVSLGEPMLELITGLSKTPLIKEYNLDQSYLGEVISAFLTRPGEGVLYHPVRGDIPTDKLGVPGVLVELLTIREQEILRLIAVEQDNREIARQLTISINTVKTHISNIYSKLGVNNRLQAVNRARQLRLI